MLSASWIDTGMAMARVAQARSKDPSTKVGCALMSPDKREWCIGYNGFAKGIADDERLHDRALKYPRIIHAELNAILNARRNLEGWTMFCTYPPCQSCAATIIQSGISFVYRPWFFSNPDWYNSCADAFYDMKEAGVRQYSV